MKMKEIRSGMNTAYSTGKNSRVVIQRGLIDELSNLFTDFSNAQSEVGQYILPCMLRLLPGISSLLISTIPVHSPAFFQNLFQVFPVLASANTSLLDAGFRVECPRNINRLKNNNNI